MEQGRGKTASAFSQLADQNLSLSRIPLDQLASQPPRPFLRSEPAFFINNADLGLFGRGAEAVSKPTISSHYPQGWFVNRPELGRFSKRAVPDKFGGP